MAPGRSDDDRSSARNAGCRLPVRRGRARRTGGRHPPEAAPARPQRGRGAGRPSAARSVDRPDREGREIGSHALSGAVLDPRAIAELLPDFLAQGCPVESPVTSDAVWFLTRGRRLACPLVPPPLRNHGNYVVSLGRLVRWLAQRAEQEGVDLFPGFAAVEPLLEGRAADRRPDGDRGIDRHGAAQGRTTRRASTSTRRSRC